ncbi:hypothetical protein CDD81_5795 [Ophiocordyceps australis]|uniref:Uncharacterized protein n=1 Tax=Ophiocordyceps australis TaxID=1399860 RepID=A0A2C5Y973_9HYPO|nr:hypothetical protein CDD81_5795 [Ophiocordyceps australis]
MLIVIFEIVAHVGFNKSSSTQAHQAPSLKPRLQLSHPLSQCGSSPAEAQKLGCRFDELSFAWQAPDCFDNKTVDEFLATGPWKYFADEAGAVPMLHEDLSLDKVLVHVAWKFHIDHCLHLRRQMVRLVLDGRPMDSHLALYKHTVHCGVTLLDADTPLDNLHTAAPVIYPACKPLPDWAA